MSVVLTKNKLIIIILLNLLFCNLFALSVGSDSIVSRQSHIIFPVEDTDNEMNGFASFEGGFALENARATCTFDSFFPISGTIDMKCGGLSLSKDLIIDEGATIDNIGSIYGNGNKISLLSDSTTFTADGYSFLLYNASSVSGANGINSLDFSGDGLYFAVGSEVGASLEYAIFSFNRTTGAMTYVNGINYSREFRAVRWNPVSDHIAVGLSSGGGVDMAISYFNRGTSGLSWPALLDLGGSGNAFAWHSSGLYLSIGTDNAAQYLRTYRFNTGAGTFGSQLTVDTQPGGGVLANAMDWDVTGSYLAVGVNNASGSELLVYYLQDSSNLTLTAQENITGVTQVSAVSWCPTHSLLTVGLSDGSERLRTYYFDYDLLNWTFEEVISYRVGESDSVLSLDWTDCGDVLTVGKAASSSEELLSYVHTDESSFILLQSTEIGSDINDARWDYNSSFLLTGDDLSAIYTYTKSSVERKNSVYIDNLFLSIDRDIEWNVTATFNSSCSMDGSGNTITLGDDCSIEVASGGTLTLKNLELKGVSSDKIKCLDDSSAIVLYGCKVNLDNNWDFSQGTLLFENDVLFTGTNKFIYSSSRTSTINSNSVLKFDHDMTFSYAPTIDNRDLLYMTDQSSLIYFDGCSINSTPTGIRFTRGKVIFDNHVTLSSEGSVESELISFGDGTATNDVDYKILAGGNLEIHGGIEDNNVN